MLLKRRLKHKIFLVLSFGFLLTPIVFQYTNQGLYSKTDYSKNEYYKDISIDTPSLNFIIFFHPDYPYIADFNELIVKKYSVFPVIHIIFNNSFMKEKFFDKYQNEILYAELVQALTNSLNIIPHDIIQKKSSDIPIQDSIGASYLHSLGIMGNRTKIGIIDTGVFYHTIEFGSRIKGRNVFITEERGYSEDISDPNDVHGHGTHVAGLAAGATTGIAPGAEIYSAKVVHDTVTVTGAGGGYGEETTLGLLDAIGYLVNNSVDVINISLGQYHNLATGLRDEIINYVTKVYNIVFTVSAGNSGSSYNDRGTLNNPSTALQCIAAAMADSTLTTVHPSASKGLKVDYSLKPDITAPGISIIGPKNTETGYITRSGTSMSAPIIGGAAALLIDYLKCINVSYSAGTIKAALLAGAQSLGNYPWEEGAGFINVTRSWDLLKSAEKINNSPNLIYIHPQQLPLDPYEVLFSGSTVTFNLTVISSRNTNIIVNVSSELSDFVRVPRKNHTISQSYLIPINFTIPEFSIPQFVSGSIIIDKVSLNVEFEVREPVIRILFDESLNRIVPHGYGFSLDGPFEILGDTSNTIGMYSAFTKYLSYENDYSITPHISGDILLSKLLKYDVLILANPFSLASDIYMDWVLSPGTDYISPSKETIEAIHQYINLGGGLLILTTKDTFYNVSALNNFLKPFDLSILNESSNTKNFCDFTAHNLNFTNSIDQFPFWGNYIQASDNYTQVIAECNGYATLVSYEGMTGGRVLLYGSDLIFDNIGFSSYAYGGVSEHNRILAFNSVAWLAEGEYKVPLNHSEPQIEYLLLFIPVLLTIAAIVSIYKSKN